MDQVREALLEQGWAVTSSAELGLDHAAVRKALSPALVPDRGWDRKLHARDVVSYDRATGLIAECDSIAHEGVDGYSRFRLMESPLPVRMATAQILTLVPGPLRRPSGRMYVDYFRYTPGIAAEAHQDEFGDLVAIWVLDRAGTGGENFLRTLDGREVLRKALVPGEVLVFRDALFLHGVEAMDNGHRDALVFIILKD